MQAAPVATAGSEARQQAAGKCKLCGKAASFGMPDGEREYCSAHKRPGNIYLKHTAKNHGEDIAAAAAHVPRGLNYAPSVGREEVARHHDASRPHCHVEGCQRAPSYGFETSGGYGMAVSCSTHRRPGEIFLKHPTNMPQPAAALKPGAEHVPRGLIHVPNMSADGDRVKHHDASEVAAAGKALCAHTGCTRAASYNFTECDTPRFCFAHKSPSMRIVHSLHVAPGMGAKIGEKPAASASAHKPGSPGSTGGNVQDSATHAAPAPATAKPGEGVGEGGAGATASAPPLLDRSVAVAPNVTEGLRFVALSHANNEDPTTAVKYLLNIAKHPQEGKYRILKKQNSRFMNEVWLNPGIRGMFQAIGFREYDRGLMELAAVSDETLCALLQLLQELVKGNDKLSAEVAALM